MIKAVLVDIEGTTSPISFVKDVLFPYSKDMMEKFIEKNRENSEIRKIIEEVKNIEGKDLSDKEVAQILIRWIEEDKKITPLKEIQGYIWEEGFKNGEIKAPVYEDAYRKLKKWKEKGLPIYIYSSGSVKAQKLFFSHTEYGNILDLFSGHFDTKIGNKKEVSSYRKIAEKIGLKPEEILFLSDNPDEIKAAADAGMRVVRLSRPEDVPYMENFPYPQVESFEEITNL
ncbi:acireductone synthase [Persephonella sp.]